MRQRTRMLIEMPEDLTKDSFNVLKLEQELIDKGCKVKCIAVLNPLEGMKIPGSFLFDDELPKQVDALCTLNETGDKK